MAEAAGRRAAWRYLAIAAATFAATLLLAAALVVAVDPYYVYGTTPVEGFNALKPAAAERSFDAKLAQAVRVRPRTLLLGNSRIEAGLDPESPAWPEPMRPVFNAGLAATGASTSLAFLAEALRRGVRPETIIIAAEFLDAVVPDPDAHSPEREPRLGREASLAARARAFAEHSLSISAVADSLRTIAAQRRPGTDTLTPSGFNPLHGYARFAETEGLHRLFAIKRAEYAVKVEALVQRSFDRPDESGSLRSLRALLDLARQHGSAVVLVVYPYHAELLGLLREAGLLVPFERWKRALVTVALAGGRQVRLIDFSAPSPETADPVPPPGERRAGRPLYWELSHFTSRLGDRMIEGIAGNGEGFGVPLTPERAEAAAGYPTPSPQAPGHRAPGHRTLGPQAAAALMPGGGNTP